MSVIHNHLPEILSKVDSNMQLLDKMGRAPLSQIGNTPLIELKALTAHLPASVTVYAKAEYLNPSGSVKDRAGLSIIRAAIQSGKLREGVTLIDSTSGNTGIAYAMIGATLGIPVEIAMPESATDERKRILRSFGAKVVLTDPDLGSDGAQQYVKRKIKSNPNGYFYANQYNNDANWHAHFEGTGPEIIDQTDGELTHFVAGVGTTGTFVGVSRRLKMFNAGVKCVSVQPNVAKHKLKGLRYLKTAMIPGIYDHSLADIEMDCSCEDAYAMTRRLAREEGILVGVSSGANVAAAIRLAEEIQEGYIVTILCDSGNRYLSHAALWA